MMKLAYRVLGAVFAYLALIVVFWRVVDEVDWVADILDRIDKPHIAFVQGEFIFGEFEINGKALDEKDLFSKDYSSDPESFDFVDVWVFLLNTFDEIESNKVARNLEIDVYAISQNQPGVLVHIEQKMYVVGWSLIPVWLERKSIILIDSAYFSSFRPDCVREVLYKHVQNRIDKDFEKACKSLQ